MNMLEDKVLTVIIPSYNMETYLPTCLRSLVVDSEWMDKLDVVVVNDGSRDRTSEIAHEFERKYPNTFRIIDKPNGNYGSCINAALKGIKGKYVKVLDADDSLQNENLVAYLKFLEQCECELVLSDYVEVDAKDIVTYEFKYDIPVDKVTNVVDLLRSYRYVPMHTIAYKSSILDNFVYHQTEGVSYTDTQWTILPMVRVKNVKYFPQKVYRYLVERSGRTMDQTIQIKNAWMYAKIGIETAEQYVRMRKEISGEKRELMDARVAALVAMPYRIQIFDNRMIAKQIDLDLYDERLLGFSNEFYDIVGRFAYKCGKYIKCYIVANWRRHSVCGYVRLQYYRVLMFLRNLCIKVVLWLKGSSCS